MNRYFWITICIFIGILLSNFASSATFDLSGDWQCTFAGAFSNGDTGCLTGPNPSASCTIEQTGDNFTLTLHSNCDPAFTCFFEGNVVQATYAGANSGALDGGGTLVNTTTFTASSMTEASGSSYSQATYPDWNCTWGFDSLVLTKVETPTKTGDVDCNGITDINDLIVTLQILAGLQSTYPVCKSADINGNGQIDTTEPIFIMQQLVR